jgi:DNA-binding CsgD family transcriptional regulator/tetratricopeptide (TPR) repeat protein
VTEAVSLELVGRDNRVEMAGRVSSPAFIGRTEELRALEAAAARAGNGQATVVLVAGEVGVGKTRLVAEFATHCTGAGTRALRGGCIPVGNGALPFAPVVEALRLLVEDLGAEPVRAMIGPSWPELARLLPSLGEPPAAPPAQAAPTRLFELLLGLLGRLAAQARLLLLIEDLHWADQSTRDLLAFLCRNLHREGVVLVATYRNDEPRSNQLAPYLAELARGGPVHRIELPRLGRAETLAQLVGILGAAPPAELVDAVYARSGGNPFFTEELLEAVRAGSLELPATVHDLLHGRVETLPAAARHVLKVIAVAGRPVAYRLLTAVAGMDSPELDDAIRAAVGGQLLVARPGEDRYDVRHALLREVVEADLLPGERTTLHLAYAHALVELPGLAHATPAALASELAAHWDAAGEPAHALPARVEAGLAAEGVRAFPEAYRQYRRALELWRAVPEPHLPGGLDRIDLLTRAAEAAALAGATQGAIGLLEDALDQVDRAAEPVRAAGLLGQLGFHRYRALGEAEALAAYEAAEMLLADQPVSAMHARMLGAHAQVLMVSSRPRRAIPLCENAISIARSVGARAEEAYALEILAGSLDDLGDLDRAIALHLEARRLAEEVGDADTVVRTYVNLGAALSLAGRDREALDDSREGYRRARELGLERAGGSFVASNLAWQLLCSGRWDECDRLTTHVLAGDAWNIFGALTAQSRLLTWRGDFTAARQRLERAVQLSPSALGNDARLTLAELDLWEGDHDAAATEIAAGLRWCAENDPEGILHHHSSPWYPLALRLEADRAERAAAARAPNEVAGARRRATAVIAQLDRLVADRTPQARFPEVVCHLALAQAERSRLEGTSDPERWHTAQLAWERLERPFEAAYAGFRRAESLLTSGAPGPQAEEALRAAHQTATTLGAAPLRREIELLARRGRLRLTEPARAPKGAPSFSSPMESFGLTRRETQVLVLVTEGRTNRQIGRELFITEKTASLHVSRILAKLGVASRVEAAAVAHRLGLSGSDG